MSLVSTVKVNALEWYSRTMERRSTVEMKALIQKQQGAFPTPPPPAPAGTSLREWFAGLAIANVELMKDIDRDRYGEEALRIADQLIFALATPRQPSVASMAALSEEQMKEWDIALANKKEDERTAEARQAKATVPNMPRVRTVPSTKRAATMIGVAIPANPPEGYVPPPSAQPIGRLVSIQPPSPTAPTEPSNRRVRPSMYSIMSPPEGTTIPLGMPRA